MRCLGRHIARGATEGQLTLLRAGTWRLRNAHGNAKVHYPGPPGTVNQNIGGLQVAVNDTGGVGRRQSVEHIPGQGQCLGRRQGAALGQQLGQGLPRHVLKHQIRLLLMHIGLKHRHDAGVGQAADTAGLLEPLSQGSRIGPLIQLHLFDGHLALQTRIKRQPDHGLRALPQNAAQLKAPEHGGFWCIRLRRREPLDCGKR